MHHLEFVFLHDTSLAIKDSTVRVKQILDDKYENKNLEALALRAMTDLNKDEHESLLSLLLQHEILFNGTLVHWYDSTCNIKLK